MKKSSMMGRRLSLWLAIGGAAGVGAVWPFAAPVRAQQVKESGRRVNVGVSRVYAVELQYFEGGKKVVVEFPRGLPVDVTGGTEMTLQDDDGIRLVYVEQPGFVEFSYELGGQKYNRKAQEMMLVLASQRVTKRWEAEKIEAERLAAEKGDATKADAPKTEAEREAERIAALKKEAERLAAELMAKPGLTPRFDSRTRTLQPSKPTPPAPTKAAPKVVVSEKVLVPVPIATRELKGRVLDAAGEPVEGAQVMRLPSKRFGSILTGKDGGFDFGEVEIGETTILAAKGRDFGRLEKAGDKAGEEIVLRLASVPEVPVDTPRAEKLMANKDPMNLLALPMSIGLAPLDGLAQRVPEAFLAQAKSNGNDYVRYGIIHAMTTLAKDAETKQRVLEIGIGELMTMRDKDYRFRVGMALMPLALEFDQASANYWLDEQLKTLDFKLRTQAEAKRMFAVAGYAQSLKRPADVEKALQAGFYFLDSLSPFDKATVLEDAAEALALGGGDFLERVLQESETDASTWFTVRCAAMPQLVKSDWEAARKTFPKVLEYVDSQPDKVTPKGIPEQMGRTSTPGYTLNKAIPAYALRLSRDDVDEAVKMASLMMISSHRELLIAAIAREAWHRGEKDKANALFEMITDPTRANLNQPDGKPRRFENSDLNPRVLQVWQTLEPELAAKAIKSWQGSLSSLNLESPIFFGEQVASFSIINGRRDPATSRLLLEWAFATVQAAPNELFFKKGDQARHDRRIRIYTEFAAAFAQFDPTRAQEIADLLAPANRNYAYNLLALMALTPPEERDQFPVEWTREEGLLRW